jgi:hypothetical protein
MNPNRLLSDLLSGFEGQLYRRQVRLEITQSQSGVLHVGKDAAESVLKLLLGRICSVARPNSLLRLSWRRHSESLSLEMKLDPPAQPSGGAPLMPLSLATKSTLAEAGIRVRAEGSYGPWKLDFDALDI